VLFGLHPTPAAHLAVWLEKGLYHLAAFLVMAYVAEHFARHCLLDEYFFFKCFCALFNIQKIDCLVLCCDDKHIYY